MTTPTKVAGRPLSNNRNNDNMYNSQNNTTYYLFPITYYLLPATYSLLPIPYYLLLNNNDTT